MFNGREYYKEHNDKYEEIFKSTVERITQIIEETRNSEDEFDKYFNSTGLFMKKMFEFEKSLGEEYFTKNTFEELYNDNKEFYYELSKEGYEKSYANPQYAVKLLGEGYGQFLCVLYSKIRKYVEYSFMHKTFEMAILNEFFIKVYDVLEAGDVDVESLNALYGDFVVSNSFDYYRKAIEDVRSIECEFYTDTYNQDLSDLRYLFRFGKCITDNEIRAARYLQTLEEEEMKELGELITSSYFRGFKDDNKDMAGRDVVSFVCYVGQERIIKHTIESFKQNGIRAGVNILKSAGELKQYGYDHKFDNSLFMNQKNLEVILENVGKAFESSKELLKDYSGIIAVEQFGEEPFTPVKKKEMLTFTEEQSQMHSKLSMRMRSKYQEYIPAKNASFAIIAFPSPEIGERYEEILADTIKINKMPNDIYEKIQQNIIDVLDQGDHVHIKGTNGNLTDIKVEMNKLKNPQKETNFFNCVSSVNIPLGEVFTTPMLEGTNGLLHLQEVFLDDFNFIDLKLVFEDGYVKEYSCKNFENEEDNKKYIEENLLFPHKTLPMGEFAIGTNTLAYMISRKYNIIEKLPILIVEKMGPHFAVGDTCYSFTEDMPVYNLINGKEIVARENSKSALRKEDLSKAYTNVHKDITIPYYALGSISAVTKDGEYLDIIKDGKFVVKGTEKLNEALEMDI